jgi:hypothetical protein
VHEDEGYPCFPAPMTCVLSECVTCRDPTTTPFTQLPQDEIEEGIVQDRHPYYIHIIACDRARHCYIITSLLRLSSSHHLPGCMVWALVQGYRPCLLLLRSFQGTCPCRCNYVNCIRKFGIW